MIKIMRSIPGRCTSTVSKTITLTGKRDGWIEAPVDAGHYIDDNESIRDLIRSEQGRSTKMEAIRAALIEGENSGEPEPFDFTAFRQRKAMQHG